MEVLHGMERVRILDSMTAEELQRRWPATIPVLLRRRMGCVGCSVAAFDTLLDMASHHGLPLEDLREELEEAASGPALATGT